MTTHDYVHGYSNREETRLLDQAGTLTDLLHHDTHYPEGSHVLEAGCGVGAQTVILAERSPLANFTSVDISLESLKAAKERVAGMGFTHVTFQQADLFHLPFPDNQFDHIFLCFVLEHLSDPVGALRCLRKVLKPGGTLTVIEGDHGSAYFHPESDAARQAVKCLVEIQRRCGGDALIGRRLYPLLRHAGFEEITVSPRMVYVDSSRPEWVEGFTRNTFTAMVEGVRKQVLDLNLMSEMDFDRGIRDLYRTADEDGVFCYTFFKGVAFKSKPSSTAYL